MAHRLAFNLTMFQEPEDFILAAFAITAARRETYRKREGKDDQQ